MHNKVLKHLGLVSILIMMMQLIYLGMVMVGKHYTNQEIILNDCLMLCVAYLSYIWCEIKEKIIDGNKVHTIVGGLLVALGRGITCIGAFYYVINQYIKTGIGSEVWFGIILAFTLVFVYVLMYMDYRRTYDRIVNLEIYVFVIVISIASSAFGIGTGGIIGLTFMTIVGAMCKNQGNIDYLLERTQKNTPMIVELRKHNIKCVLVAMLFLILAYSLRGVVAVGLKLIWQGTTYILGVIIRFLFRARDTGVPMDLNAGEMGVGYGIEEGKGTNIYKIIACIVIGVICILKRKEIWTFIERKVSEIMDYIKKAIEWLQKFLFHVDKKKRIVTPYYSERVEDIKNIEVGRVGRKKGLNRRRLERKIKELSEIADQTLQYRKKYKLLIQALIWRGAEVKRSDTPRQIHHEVLKKFVNLNLEKETKGYENVRYGEMQVTSEAQESLDEHLKSIIKNYK